MSETKGRRWLCHRCVKKEGTTTDIDPLLKVCEGCQVENWTRLTLHESVGVVEPEPVKVEEAVIEAETVEETKEEEQETEVREEGPVSEGLGQPDTNTEEPADVPETEPVDPYKGLTKAQLVEMLKEKE